MAPLLLTVAETAQLLNVSEDRVYRMARAGILPIVKVGRLTRINKEQLNQWIASGGQTYPNERSQSLAN